MEASTVTIESQGHLFKVKASGCPAIGGGKRGKVSGFSSASRKRLLERLACLRSGRRDAPLFITLTYPDAVDCDTARRDLRAWAKRVKRRFPAFGCVWRLELQRRGVPHFHVLVWGIPFFPVALLRSLWVASIGYTGPSTVQVNIKKVRGWRGLLGYVAKYMGKVQDGFQMAESVTGGEAALLDDVTYLSALSGRVWGFLWRDSLPWAEKIVFQATWGRWFFPLRRAARRKWRGIWSNAPGFTLFCDHPDQWQAYGVLLASGSA